MSTLSYQYQSPSSIIKNKSSEELFLSKFNEDIKGTSSCFFWGRLTDPYITSRCLITLSKIVQSNFAINLAQLALIKDPIVTSGNDQIRFEAFSMCAGVYARTDVLENGHDGDFLENGTTNVDFNIPLITELNKIKKADPLVLSVGPKEVGFHKDGKSTIERKVPLPTKWIKGLTTVQYYLADCHEVARLTKIQAITLFRSIKMGKVKTDYHLVKRGSKFLFAPTAKQALLTVGGIHRLALLQPLLPLINSLSFYKHESDQSVNIVLHFDKARFTFCVSRNYFRGFSGEGAALDDLLEDLPERLIRSFDNYSFANQEFNQIDLAVDHDLPIDKIENLSSKLAAMGLLGFDLTKNSFYYRRLPFKLQRILSLNPRLKGADTLLEKNMVKIIKNEDDHIEARVIGSKGYDHIVSIKPNQEKCTCLWYSKNQGERGSCKHVLATKKLIQNT